MALFCGIPALRGRWEFRGTLQSRRRPDGESRPAEAGKFGNEGLMSGQVDNLQSIGPSSSEFPTRTGISCISAKRFARSWNNCRRRWWRIILPKSGG